MLTLCFTLSGNEVDLQELDQEELEGVKLTALAWLRQPDALALYIEDHTVAFVPAPAGILVSALDRVTGDVARKLTTLTVAENLLLLAMDDTSSYDGVEQFFSNFGVRFVP
jgi:hypothetical protein